MNRYLFSYWNFWTKSLLNLLLDSRLNMDIQTPEKLTPAAVFVNHPPFCALIRNIRKSFWTNFQVSIKSYIVRVRTTTLKRLASNYIWCFVLWRGEKLMLPFVCFVCSLVSFLQSSECALANLDESLYHCYFINMCVQSESLTMLQVTWMVHLKLNAECLNECARC